MKSSGLKTAMTSGLLFLTGTLTAAAVEFGVPDFPNYISRPGLVTCDWRYDSNIRSCPEPAVPDAYKAKPKVESKAKAKEKSAKQD